MIAVVDCDSADEEGNDEEGAGQGEIMTAELLGASHTTILLLLLPKEKKRSKQRKMRHFYLILQKQIKSLTS